MKLCFRDKGLQSFDAKAVALEASELHLHEQSTFHHSSSSSRQLRVIALDLSYNQIHTFLGARCLPHLETLDMSHNALRNSLNLPASLVRLDISHNTISSLVGLDTLTKLQHLDASHNRIEELGRLPGSLQVINLSNNALKSTEDLGHLVHVTKLHMDRNRIGTIAQTLGLSTMKALRHLHIVENPVTSNPKLVSSLEFNIPKLTTLDGVPLSQAHASMTFRAQQRKTSESASVVRKQAAKIARFQADLDGSRLGDAVEQELRTLTTRVRELERMATAQYESEVKIRREYALTKQQERQTNAIVMEQDRQIQTLQSELETDASTVDSLERTLMSLERAFQQQHAMIVMKKLQR